MSTRPTRRRALFAGGLVAALLVGVAGCGNAAQPTTGPAGEAQVGAISIPGRADFQWVIPAGTRLKVNLGEHDGIFPPALFARIGQTVRIINEDTIGYTIGPFYVGPKQTLEQVFRTVGTFEGECTTHKGQRFALVVER